MDAKQQLVDRLIARFDANGDGQIAVKEFIGALRKEGADPATIHNMTEHIYGSWDANSDSVLDAVEVKQMASSWVVLE